MRGVTVAACGGRKLIQRSLIKQFRHPSIAIGKDPQISRPLTDTVVVVSSSSSIVDVIEIL